MTELLHDLSDWLLSFADSDWAIAVLLVSSFAESIFFPIPPDPLLLAVAIVQQPIAALLGVLVAVASVAGAVVGHALGMRLGRPVLAKMFSEGKVAYVDRLFERYGVWAILIAAFTPCAIQGLRYCRGRVAYGQTQVHHRFGNWTRGQVRRNRCLGLFVR